MYTSYRIIHVIKHGTVLLTPFCILRQCTVLSWLHATVARRCAANCPGIRKLHALQDDNRCYKTINPNRSFFSSCSLRSALTHWRVTIESLFLLSVGAGQLLLDGGSSQLPASLGYKFYSQPLRRRCASAGYFDFLYALTYTYTCLAANR